MAFEFLFALIRRPPEESRRAFSLLLPLAFLIILPTTLLAQATVQGTVSDRTGEPLVGAQVQIEGTDQGAVTDGNGTYVITGAPTGSVVLQAIYLGYRTERQSAALVAGTNTVDFAMSASPIELDAIVVTGTAGAVQKRAIGNAVTDIDAEAVVETAPVTNLSELITARSAGTVVLPSSGTVGTGTSLRLRGLSSITQSNEPLLYVDGVRIDNNDEATSLDGFTVGGQGPSRINDINIEDIESIEIIKGPAAATLYGTEAAPGVIQIITKKGRSGDARWNVRGSWGTIDLDIAEFEENFGIVDPADLPLGVSSLDELQGVHLVKENADGTWLIAQDPFDELIETGVTQEYDLSVSGGQDDFTFYASGNFLTEDGPMPANWAEKVGGRANFQWTPSNIFDMAISSGYVNNEIRLPNNDNNIFGFWGNLTLATPAGIRQTGAGNFAFGEPFTSVEDVREIDSRFTNDRFTGSATANFNPLPWLKARGIFGIDINAEENFQFIPFGAVANLNPEGEKTNVRNTTVNITFDQNTTAIWDLTEALQSSTSFGTQVTNENVDEVVAFGEDFPAPGVSTVSAAGNTQGFETRVEDTTVGLYVQEQLAWQNRLFLTGAVRFDDNSAFGSEFDFETYPKVSASWVVSEEPFFSVPGIDNLRFRAAYGFAGQQPAAFTSERTFLPVAIKGGVPTITPDQFGNPDLGPERSREVEVGFDAGLWEDRIGVELTYYDKVTEDALVAKIIPPSSGFPTNQLTNIGELQNNGWELSVDGLVVDTGFIDYNILMNLATNDNEVTSLGGEAPFPTPNSFNQRVEEGFPLDGVWGRVEVGRDENGDPILSEEQEFLGRTTPDFTLAFGNTFTIRDNLQIYALFDMRRGFVIDNNNTAFELFFGSNRAVNDPDFDQRELADLFFFANAEEPTPFVDKGDFVKLREVSVSYTLPAMWAAAMRAERASVVFSGRNLQTWTDYNGIDPEVNGFGQGDIERTDFLSVPQSRRFIATLNLTF
ncbi:MAG TPA: SusC/RagA family TonB-linked outer membrane protein [Gemmatimonadota bacterium]|nr:SusC/RagA family TonB-linked outer membrane protein [Gemmatimonadota bacterium]